MNRIMVIVGKDIKETLRNRAFYISIAMMLLVVVALTLGMGDSVSSLAKQGLSEVQITSAIQPILGAVIFLLSFLLMMLFSMYVNNYMVVIEKVKRTIESLMCTPVSLRQIWIGKSLAVFLPSLVLGLLLTLGSVGLMVYSVLSKTGYLVLPGAAAMVASLVMVPVVIFLISCLTVMLQMIIANVRLINILFVAVIFGVAFGFSSSLRITSSSWSIVFVALGVALILGLVVFFLLKFLTKERVILSSKG